MKVIKTGKCYIGHNVVFFREVDVKSERKLIEIKCPVDVMTL